jgi:hypothetical protein
LGWFRDRRWRWGRFEILSTVSDVDHCCFQVLVECVVIDSVLAP